MTSPQIPTSLVPPPHRVTGLAAAAGRVREDVGRLEWSLSQRTQQRTALVAQQTEARAALAGLTAAFNALQHENTALAESGSLVQEQMNGHRQEVGRLQAAILRVSPSSPSLPTSSALRKTPTHGPLPPPCLTLFHATGRLKSRRTSTSLSL